MVLKIPQLYYDLAEKFYKRRLTYLNENEIEMEDLYEDIELWLEKDLKWTPEAVEDATGKLFVGLKDMGYISRKDEEESEEIIYEVL